MRIPSLEFVGFFLLAALGWLLLPRKVRKPWLLLACYVFYYLAGGAFAFLLAGETLLGWLLALAAEKRFLGRRKLWTGLGAAAVLLTLCLFKYVRFFLSAIPGFSPGFLTGWAVPVGISFFSFTIAGYLFDVHREKYPAERNLLDYALFAAFFPTLLSGPIERGSTLLPQIRELPSGSGEERRRGLIRFFWGAAKKLVAADTIGLYVDACYADPSAVSGGAMLFAVLLYSFQIYLDFSGYSDMAIGCGQMLGFRLTENFRAPYLTTGVKEFWRRWHISLTSWFREYLYFPLGGSRRGKTLAMVNVLIVFAVSGLWHGAGLTFILWGLLNGAFLVMGSLTLPGRKKLWQRLGLREDGALLCSVRCAITFCLITGAWILFRAESLDQGVYVVKHILLILRDGFGMESALSLLPEGQRWVVGLSLVPFVAEDAAIRMKRGQPGLLENPFLYWGAVLLLCIAVCWFGVYGMGFDTREFVYFQF